jgi:hypothetical protein
MRTGFTRWRSRVGNRNEPSKSPRGDAHELGLYGSAAYIYQYGPQLRKNVFQYINTDQLTTGDPFVVSASPGLYAFMKQICDVVPAGDGKGMLGMRDTAEDNLDGLRTYDPGMRETVVTAQVTGIQAMRAANATVAPLRIEEIPAQMLEDLLPLQAATLERTNGAVTLAELRTALDAYRAQAHQTDLAMQQAEAEGDVAAMQSLAAREQASRDAFFAEAGLLQNAYYHTIDRVFTSFPEIVFASGKPETLQTALARMMAAIRNATTALSSLASQ